MKKYYKIEHYKNKKNTLDIYFNFYRTKSGTPKIDIEMYAAQVYNENGFISRIAKYNTNDTVLYSYIQKHNDFYFAEV